jgi:hypothetical protein
MGTVSDPWVLDRLEPTGFIVEVAETVVDESPQRLRGLRQGQSESRDLLPIQVSHLLEITPKSIRLPRRTLTTRQRPAGPSGPISKSQNHLLYVCVRLR